MSETIAKYTFLKRKYINCYKTFFTKFLNPIILDLGNNIGQENNIKYNELHIRKT